ncbi:MAG: hypothetical protein ACKVOI_20840 [Dongiaceae bacterium]
MPIVKRLACAVVFGLMLAPPQGRAADIDAFTMGAVSDLLSSASPDRPPTGADSAAYRSAVEALQKAGLAGVARPPQPGDIALLEAYGRALLLGPRAKQFGDQIGTVHDAVVSGDRKAVGAAIAALYKTVGRPAPEGAALDRLIDAAVDAGGGRPAPTVNHSIQGNGYRIDIADAVAAGKTIVEVTLDQGPDGQPARVVFDGTARTRAKTGGDGLERRIEPDAPCVMTQADAAKVRERLNGDWAGRGSAWKVDGSGDRITLTETRADGHKLAYEGSYRLGKIDARHAITDAADMGAELPAAVRQQLADMGLFFTLRLETCREAAELTGRWGSQHVTYGANDLQVSRVHDPYDVTITLSGKPRSRDYQIVGLEIGYTGWQRKQSDLRARLVLAEDDQRRAADELRRRNSEYEERVATTRRLHESFIAAEARYAGAVAQLNNYVPADADKSADYRKLEQKRDRLQRRVNMLYDGIIANRGHVISDSAFETYYRLEAELKQLNAGLERMGRDLGFVREHERLLQAAQDAFVAQIRAETDFLAAVAVQDGAHGRLDAAELGFRHAQEKLSAAEQELANFSAGAFRIVALEAEEGSTMRYQVRAWDPSDVLAFLDKQIAELGRILERAERARRDSRAAFLDAQETASYAQQRLASGIMKSAAAQGLAEFGFNIADVVEKAVEAGPVGAIGETAKKVGEAILLGPPSFYEPSLAPEIMTGDGGPFSDIRANLEDALKYSSKRAVKSAVTSPTASYIIARYIASRDTRTYMQLIDQAIEGSMATGYRLAGQTQAEAAGEAFKALEKAQANLKKARDLGMFRNFAGLTNFSFKAALKQVVKSPQAGKLAHSVARDLAKMATKKAFAEYFEGLPMAEYVAAEAEARILTQIFLAASGVYWEAYDNYNARVADRREILRQFDPKNHMQILRNQRFPDGADLLIVLRDGNGQPLPALNHRVTVKLGGKPVEQVAADQFFFRVAASDLQHDGKGGVVLDISVEE